MPRKCQEAKLNERIVGKYIKSVSIPLGMVEEFNDKIMYIENK